MQDAVTQDDLQHTAKECIDAVLGTSGYAASQVNQWTSAIAEMVLANLAKSHKPYKFIVNCVIMQKCGAGLHMASTCYWDNSTDVSTSVRWENKSMYCVATVYASAI